jgi:Arc/MetJ-type ribon-helix-helix transcriptional regulator
MAKYTSHPFVGKSYRSEIRAGRPKKPNMKKITVSLNEKQISWLDQLLNSIRDSGAIVDRSTLIRGIIDAFNEKQVQEVIRKISLSMEMLGNSD